MASRRKSRELALQMLFQCELGKHTPEHVLATFLRAQKADPAVLSFARELFEGTLADIQSLDRLIGEQAANWRLERMAAVDRNLLRLALYELLHHPETPAAVVIDEALEIARRFSGDDSVEFVNGVLDGIRKSLGATKREE
ncbi:MAG: transcription antitermination factor NusB [Terriglobia bacterium]